MGNNAINIYTEVKSSDNIIYTELNTAGKNFNIYGEVVNASKYHDSLRGRDEQDQHPISAITDLEDNLTNLSNNNISFQQHITELQDQVNLLKNELETFSLDDYYKKYEIDEKIEALNQALDEADNTQWYTIEDLLTEGEQNGYN